MSELPVDTAIEPVDIREEDLNALRDIQVLVDTLSKYRQEMGRLTQLIGNIREQANEVEVDLATKRRALADKYDLKTISKGQWALDFETKQFVKPASGTPTIP